MEYEELDLAKWSLVVYTLYALKHLTGSFYHWLFLLVFDAYSGIANKDITDSIKSEMSGDLEDALLAVGEFPALKLCLQSN